MTNKEQLEEIKKKYFMHENYVGKVTISHHVLEWLIEQVERAQELEETVEDYKTVNKELHQRGRKVRKQNKRYREALAFYADEETYETKFATDTDEIFDPFTLIELDEGKRARQVLDGEQ